ncbi:MAG TPA: sigma-70 family RNA polymerase sigma factor [Candidatus Dormibacteraeota bacterium]
MELLRRYHGALMRLAMTYVQNPQIAEDVVQDAWLTAIRSLDSFAGRSSLKTWISGIVINIARAKRRKESRLVSLGSVFSDFAGRRKPTVDPSRFGRDGAWRELPRVWENVPESSLIEKETLGRIKEAIDALPPKHREVIVLRDVGQLDASEVTSVLGISPENQRVRLHRARAAVRKSLEDYLT